MPTIVNPMIYFKNASINLISVHDSNFIYFSERIKGLPENGIELINPRQENICSNCTWHQFSIKNKKGKLIFPIHIDFYSTNEIKLYNQDPSVQFSCGENIYSKDHCLLTINHIINNEIKLVFYSESSDISFIPQDIKYTEYAYKSKVLILEEKDIKYTTLNCQTSNKPILFPNICQDSCFQYYLSSDKFLRGGECTLW